MDVHIKRLRIEGFKRFGKFDLLPNASFCVIVGDNETGKSTLLEAVTLVLSGQYDGRLAQYALDPYMFTQAEVADFFIHRRNGRPRAAPRVLLEAYLDASKADPALAALRGTNNTLNDDCPGLTLTVEVDSQYADALDAYAVDDSNPAILPVEFYRTSWRSFAGNGVTLRNLPFRVATIDASHARVHRGPNRYVSQRVSDVLTDQQQRALSLAYKKLHFGFTKEPGVVAINTDLEKRGNPATKKKLSLQMDMSSRSTWDNTITPHLDDLPFDCSGKGEQCRVQTRLAIVDAQYARLLLVEEPENHLSHSNLSILLDDIRHDCSDRQVLVTTHSAFVLNKLGLDSLRLVSHAGQALDLGGLTHSTRDYFMKLPGYDTLRLVLSRQSILVEGPSDELVVQRAFKDKHGKLPLEAGVDVISVGSLAFARFLEIAALLKLHVSVITDNDGDVATLQAKYAQYLAGTIPNIRVFYDSDVTCRTLEPQLLKANSLALLNKVFGQAQPDEAALLAYMSRHKTDCALKLFETQEAWVAPKYITDAI